MDEWAIWLIIILFLIVCIGIIIWFAIDNNIPGGIRDRVPPTYDEERKYGPTVNRTIYQPTSGPDVLSPSSSISISGPST